MNGILNGTDIPKNGKIERIVNYCTRVEEWMNLRNIDLLRY